MPKASRGGRITVLSARDQCSETKPRLLAKIGLHPQLKRDSGRGAAASIIVRMSLDFYGMRSRALSARPGLWRSVLYWRPYDGHLLPSGLSSTPCPVGRA